ncbi:MAG TPA: hypothetical protein VFU65_04750 [Actinocrinis sp.]|nr:hypothetical protein [Actinocrinis sp.]
MSKVTCLCGNTISSNQMPEFTFHLVSKETYALFERLFEVGQFDQSALWMIREDHQLFKCDNCDRLLLEDHSTGRASFFERSTPPRVWADPQITDGLGRIWLRSERSKREISDQQLLPFARVTAYWDGGETAGLIVAAVDETENEIAGEWSLTTC